MPSLPEVLGIFKSVLPPDVTIHVVPLRKHVDVALGAPFIQRQIDLGIYTQENIYTDFLSWAASSVVSREVFVCFELLELLVEGGNPTLALAYVESIALHEAHHFELKHATYSLDAQIENEHECIAAVKAADPALAELAALFEAGSAVHQRVFARIEALKEARDGREQTPVLS